MTMIFNKIFKNAIRVLQKDEKNLKYTNQMFRNSELANIFARVIGLRAFLENPDQLRTPFGHFIIGTFDGTIKSDIFMGLVEAMAVQHDKCERGVGMQNFKYAPAYTEFMHLIYIYSPKTYRFITRYLPAHSERSIKYNEARQPKFPIGLTERTFSLFQEQLDLLDYAGPLCLSVDDTKLHPALRPYYDKTMGGYFILGSTGDPLKIMDADQFQDIVQKAQLTKATKLHLFCIQVPLPKIRPIPLAEDC